MTTINVERIGVHRPPWTACGLCVVLRFTFCVAQTSTRTTLLSSRILDVSMHQRRNPLLMCQCKATARASGPGTLWLHVTCQTWWRAPPKLLQSAREWPQ